MKTPITYYGGKQTMLKHILPLIPQHSIYTESFCGGGAVFFAKEPAKCEVINDIYMDIINFYECLQGNYEELKKKIDCTLHSRDTHSHARHILRYPHFFTKIERAWAVWVLSKESFASRLDAVFGYDFSGGMPKKVHNAKENFCEVLKERLQKVTIESRDALKVISTYDKADAFHFVDPPYIGTSCGHYKDSFSEDDLSHLLDLLSQVKGKFMLTMFPNDLIKEYVDKYKWTIHTIERTISASRTSRRKQEEWIVCNYTIDDNPKCH
ncbi:MAG: methyltransferase [Bacteroidia bacterium]|nr:MAG: methyltransferase [Bacteroidia bacterium]